ncbi:MULTISPECIES: ABC transporter ATP-binding protein [Micrococcales]|uniref:ABC transporter n=2 Tax=Brevibacterium TaxID=1696 RepID=A0A2A3YW28_BREAU|nr:MULTISPECIES: ABC transporter ATP-binding protein [Micrococcales]MDN5608369.1 ABC transporter ATP-binding protein [Brevibacterium sp.]SMX99241.1 energy-coupling factor transport system ATP-binding protein [Brevibacterium sp. Mu109]AZT93854.1 ABC transporter [Brevibacterium aurantiacum]MDN5659634.1 ABC transporter ATP-binding protein [Brevibacterium aurantiacum]PCC16826.1 ABC transporter [Brevibacterium aurantiacum]
MIHLDDVSFSYTAGATQLRHVSFQVSRGEFVVLTGPSGCGKTTLTRVLNGLVPGFYGGELEGGVQIDGTNARELQSWEYGRLVGSVFQDPKTQFFAPVVRDELAFGCENYGFPPEDIQARIEDLSHRLGVSHLLDRALLTLSSGEKQKVAVAAAAGTRPPLYVMDEPSANLDLDATRELAGVLTTLKESGSTIVIAEHRLTYLMHLADRIVYMDDGDIRHEYTPAQLQNLPQATLEELGLRDPVLRTTEPGARHVSHTSLGGDPTVEVTDLTVRRKGRGASLLTSLSFTLQPGEVVALAGPNGAGKTTLGRTLCGLERAGRGTICLRGAHSRRAKRSLNTWFVMQDADSQLFSDSVLGEMTHGAKSTPDSMAQAQRVLTQLGLWEYRNRHPGSLSGGQKQRLTIAVALMQNRQFIMLDEPTSGLDGRNLRRVVDCITEQAERGKTILVITHDPEFIRKACTRMLLVRDQTLTADVPLEPDTFGLALDHLNRKTARHDE